MDQNPASSDSNSNLRVEFPHQIEPTHPREGKRCSIAGTNKHFEVRFICGSGIHCADQPAEQLPHHLEGTAAFARAPVWSTPDEHRKKRIQVVSKTQAQECCRRSVILSFVLLS